MRVLHCYRLLVMHQRFISFLIGSQPHIEAHISRFPCCTVNASVCSSSDANLIGQLATGNTTTRAVDDHERGHAAVAAPDPSKRLTVFGITRCFCATKTGQCCCLNAYLPNSPQTRCVNCRGLHVCSKKGMNFPFFSMVTIRIMHHFYAKQIGLPRSL